MSALKVAGLEFKSLLTHRLNSGSVKMAFVEQSVKIALRIKLYNCAMLFFVSEQF